MNDAKCGRSIGTISQKNMFDVKKKSKKNVFSPPRSPKSPVGELRFEQRESKEQKEPDKISIRVKKCVNDQNIPTFYFKKNPPFRRRKLRSRRDRYRPFVPKILSEEELGLKHVETLRHAFRLETGKSNSACLEEFVDIAKSVWDVPTFMGSLLFRRILPAKQQRMRKNQTVSLETVLSYWNRNMRNVGYAERLFRILKLSDDDEVLNVSNLRPLLDEIVSTHRGLRFLEDTPEFQEKYIRTCMSRIFYELDSSWSGQITLQMWQQSDISETLLALDNDADVNRITVGSYFSYEHFYVIYCKFWELDEDHDCVVHREEMLGYANHALTRRIVDRIFDSKPRPQGSSKHADLMTYEHFVFFYLAEKDKTSPVSQRYWFRLLDLDEDGVIDVQDMEYFFEEQQDRMDSLGHEIVLFEDMLCQITDMIRPRCEGRFSTKDLFRMPDPRRATVFFDVLFNLQSFLQFEQRDPFLERHQYGDQGPRLTPWEIYARDEYARLAREEEIREREGRSDGSSDDDELVDEDLRLELDDEDDDFEEEDEDVSGSGSCKY